MRRRTAPKLKHPEVVEDLWRASLVAQCLQPGKRGVVAREPKLGDGGFKLRARRIGRGRGHGQRGVARLGPLTRRRVRAAQRQPRLIEGGCQRQRLFEMADLRARGLGQQAPDVLLERRQGWTRAIKAGGGGGWHEAPGCALDNRQQVFEASALLELEADSARVDSKRLHVHCQRPVQQVHPASDDRGGSDELSDLDDRAASECGLKWNLQAIEGAHALVARDRIGAEAVEIVGEQERDAFAQPRGARFATGLKRRHQQAARGDLLRLDQVRRRQGERHGENRRHQPHAGSPDMPDMSISTRQDPSPVAWQATIFVWAAIPSSANTRLMAAA